MLDEVKAGLVQVSKESHLTSISNMENSEKIVELEKIVKNLQTQVTLLGISLMSLAVLTISLNII